MPTKDPAVSEYNLELKKTHDSCKSKSPKLTVVFLHGIAADSSTFNDTLDFLEKDDALRDVRFVTFDLLGSGKSYRSDELEYNYDEQLAALDAAIQKLEVKTPLVLVGHSMGSLVAANYTRRYSPTIRRLILVSTPVYTKRDLSSPAFKAALEVFKEALSVKMRKILQEKSFNNSIKNIVSNGDNYDTLASLDIPTSLVYGELDQFIAPFNYPKLLKANPNCTKIKTKHRHGMSKDKYVEICKILKTEINIITEASEEKTNA